MKSGFQSFEWNRRLMCFEVGIQNFCTLVLSYFLSMSLALECLDNSLLYLWYLWNEWNMQGEYPGCHSGFCPTQSIQYTEAAFLSTVCGKTRGAVGSPYKEVAFSGHVHFRCFFILSSLIIRVTVSWGTSVAPLRGNKEKYLKEYSLYFRGNKTRVYAQRDLSTCVMTILQGPWVPVRKEGCHKEWNHRTLLWK